MHTKEEKLAAFSRLLDVQDRLRLQCPWDKKQTFESLRPNTIEETFELCDALMKRDYKDIKKELGDVLEHVMFYSIIGREDGEFDIDNIDLVADITHYCIKGLEVPFIYGRLGHGMNVESSKPLVAKVVYGALGKSGLKL